MKQKSLLLYWSMLTLMPILCFGQNAHNYRDMMITEISIQNVDISYIEFTNVGKDTLDLSKYWAQTAHDDFIAQATEGSGEKAELAQYPGHVLLPGKSITIARVLQSNQIDRYGNKLYPHDRINAELYQIIDGEKNQRYKLPGYNWLGQKPFGLFTRADTNLVPDGIADSVQIDQFWFQKSDAGYTPNWIQLPIAGVVTAAPFRDRVWVRKFKFKNGNNNFNLARGTNLEDSEWMPLPNDLGPYDKLYTTVGSHLKQETLEMTPIQNNISIDLTNMNINLPYDIPKDSIFRFFNFGPCHAWDFFQGPDTSSYFAAEGDSIEIYVLGDEMKTFKFALKPQPKPANFAKVFPIIYKTNTGSFTKKYTVSDGHLPMDTIGQIDYNTPIDSLVKFLGTDNNAVLDFIWVDNVARPEVKNGDILRVTSGSKTKEYKLSVWPFNPSHISQVATIVFPGIFIWENPNTYQMTDTMLTFRRDNDTYIVNLPQEITTCPGILVRPLSSFAKTYVSRAKNIFGSDEDRTITVKVTAEDDTTVSVYKFLLNIERETPKIVGTPFFTDIAGKWESINHSAIQICNPSDEIIRISDYLVMYLPSETGEFNNFITNKIASTLNAKTLNKYTFRPGSVINYDITGNVYFENDHTVSRLEIGPQELFLAEGAQSWPAREFEVNWSKIDMVDMLIGGGGLNKARSGEYWFKRWGTTGDFPYVNLQPSEPGNWFLMNGLTIPHLDEGPTFALFEILNDSVKQGLKPVYKDFFEDYKLVDVINGLEYTGVDWKLNYKHDGHDSLFDVGVVGAAFSSGHMYRTSDVYSGNPVGRASFGTKGNAGEWVPYAVEYTDGVYALLNYNNTKGDLGRITFGKTRVKNHTIITSAHISYITSPVYNISKGLSESETIFGILPNTSVNTFMNNIIKVDDNMTVVVKGASGEQKLDNDQLVDGDKVISTAANKLSSVTYTVNVGSLNNNVTLTAKAGAPFTINALTIQNVPFKTTLNELMAQITAPANASVLVTDGDEYIIPFETWANDTNTVQRTDASVSDKYVIEVTAQDGVTKAKYSIAFEEETNLSVISDVYTVDQSIKEINYVQTTNVANFLANLIPSPGAEMKVINKLGQQREIGAVQFHDKLVVSKGDKTVLYYIKFFNEQGADAAKHVDSYLSTVYPNPTSGKTIISGLEKATDLRITNVTGQVVQSVKVNSESVHVNMNYKSGIYFISIMNKNKIIETHKVIVK